MRIEVLGCSGAIAKNCYTSSFLVGERILFDAGTGLGLLTLAQLLLIDDVFITHAHLDHIAALPLMLDSVLTTRSKQSRPPVRVHALPATIAAMRQFIFNDTIWPNFEILPSTANPILQFIPIAHGQVIELSAQGIVVEVLPAVHTVAAAAYAAWQTGDARVNVPANVPARAWVYTGDTERNAALFARLRHMPVGALVIEAAFSNSEQIIATRSLHLCPNTLLDELAQLAPHADFPIYITHTKPSQTAQIMHEIQALMQSRNRHYDIRTLESGEILQWD